MRRRQLHFHILAVSILAAISIFAGTTLAFAAHSQAIDGTWTATDTADGSRMRLWIRPDRDIDSLYDIRYFDQSCGGCSGLPGTGRFIGLLVEENHIHGIGYFRSQGHTYFYQLEGDWYYDPNTDTIAEDLAGGWNTWYRTAND